ncbi:FAD-dependent monooxygenase [Alteromonas lipolytica]|uniref:Salicylate 1-monooxygenase n=1 Tax=Alteromonas lipolytica TaxID=1856405 RepID=A0A1E8FBQ0_9ALTE|nr:FAD-dependent monooxygenase [Alteromonas lipolytica]OFI33352.1 salicylate 1-monooxygenase [Alteromonas lipolytica]GGF60485.1 monooxygenase [Alteromonas lipolytica]
MQNLTIAVVGAGIAGLTAVNALAKAGHNVHLFEAAPAWGDVGAGITLAPNAMRGLDYIGVGEEVANTGVEPTSQNISHWESGETLLTVVRSNTKEQYGSAYVYIHRADLHTILVKAAEQNGVTIHLNKQLETVNTDGEQASIVFADGETFEADLVIGADGLKSNTRKLFKTQAPHFTGHIAYRALAPASPAIQALIDQPGMHIGPGKMVVRYPLRKGDILNLVFFTRQEGWEEDGWAITADIDELKGQFEGWCPDIQTLLNEVKPGTVFKWAINAHKPLQGGWSKDAKVTLIGDAAHAMTPFLGQGAATGIEDAVMLSRVITDADSLHEALERYEAARFERTSFIQKESNENADRLQGEESEMYGLGNLRNEETLGLFSYDCVTEKV